jgi:hypothetical protein
VTLNGTEASEGPGIGAPGGVKMTMENEMNQNELENSRNRAYLT